MVAEEPLRVCLQRSLELTVTLSFREWPGYGRVVLHAPDAHGGASIVDGLAATLAPRYRVLSLAPRLNMPDAVRAQDLLSILSTLGCDGAVLVGEGNGCRAALLACTWQPALFAGLVLVEPTEPLEPVGVGQPVVPLERLEAFLAELDAAG